MDFFKKYLSEIIDFFLSKLENNSYIVIRVKDIRKYYKIKPSNRSKINFFWRILEKLENQDFLFMKKVSRPKVYYMTENLKLLLKGKNKKEICSTLYSVLTR